MINELTVYYFLIKEIDYVKVKKNYEELKETLTHSLDVLKHSEYNLDQLVITYLINTMSGNHHRKSKKLIEYCEEYLNEDRVF